MKLFKSKRFILPLFITILSLFMGVCYATVNGTMLDLFGMAKAIVLEEIYISDINNTDNIIVNNYDGTLLNSKVVLDATDIESTKSIDITLSNNTKSHQFFEEVRYQLGDITYDNDNIEVILDERLTRGYELQPKESITFTLTFKYTEEYKDYIKDNPEEPLNNELNSIINFYFGYLIKFYQGKGNMKPDNYYLASNSTYLTEITEEIPTRVGYIFMGWYDKEDYLEGQMFYDERENPTRLNDLILSSYEIKLYAGWKPIEYTITYHQDLLPEVYQELEYIESNKTQYIDTGYRIKKGLRYKFQFSTLENASPWFGMNSSGKEVMLWYSGNNIYMGSKLQNYTPSLDTIYSIDLDLGSTDGTTNILQINNETIGTNKSDVFDKPVYLFKSDVYLKQRYYYFQIYDGDTLVLDLIPCYIKNTDEAGMYDLINGKFYNNISGGYFIKGPEVTQRRDSIINRETIKYDTEFYLSKNNAYEDNIVSFLNWNTSSDGSGITYNLSDKLINLSSRDGDNIDVYAVFERPYRITFDGVIIMNIKNFNKELIILSDKKGGNFTGWYSEAGEKYFDQLGNQLKSIEEDIILYPKYKIDNMYESLLYIESTKKEYIDTGYRIKKGLRYKFQFSTLENASPWFGMNSPGKEVMLWYSGNNIYMGSKLQNYTPSLNTIYSIDLDLGSTDGSTNVLTINNENIGVNKSDVYDKPVYLFRSDVYLKQRYYYFQIYDGNTLVLDLIPCIKKETLEVGMYDMENDVFYSNNGNGEFIAGPKVVN